jgi:DNA helicase HerA-like ATPase
MNVPSLYLGSCLPLGARGGRQALIMPAHHLVLHGIVVGMTGSGKTGLVTVLAEEALRCKVPTLLFDIKGDLSNLLLALPSFAQTAVLPWAAGLTKPGDERSAIDVAAAIAEARKAEAPCA